MERNRKTNRLAVRVLSLLLALTASASGCSTKAEREAAKESAAATSGEERGESETDGFPAPLSETESAENLSETETTPLPYTIVPGGKGDMMRMNLNPDSYLDFVPGDGGYTLRFGSDGGSEFNAAPVRVNVIASTYGEPVSIARAYEEVTAEGEEITATAHVKTEAGSVFLFVDRYCARPGGVLLSRSVVVEEGNEADKGYSSEFRVGTNEEAGTAVPPEWFIPSLLYQDSGDMIPTAAFAENTLEYDINTVRETRCGLPMIMMRDPESGFSVTVSHIARDIGDEDVSAKAAGAPRRIDSACRYGSVGIVGRVGEAQSLSYIYPFYEYPRVYGFPYDGKAQGAACFHPVAVGERQEYELLLTAQNSEDFNDAMIGAYLTAYAAQPVTIAEEDTDYIYDVCMRDLRELYTETKLGRGMPFAVFIDNGEIHSVSFQIGFIGMQTTLAHHMLRYGLQQGDEDSVAKGKAILDFWATLAGTESGAVKVWFDDTTFRRYPPFLRIMSDGMEGMLDAVMAAEASGREDLDSSLWSEMTRKFADFLVEYQNEDGSFWRAYDYHGNPYRIGNPDGLVGDYAEIGGVRYDKTVGDSKLNTAIPVRFLVRFYERMGDERYLNAAESAGEYVLRELYPSGRYVGGTPDNPNTVDKEAGMYAMFAYSALYGATGEEKYLAAMEQAAVYTMSWMYVYRFRVPNHDKLRAGQAAALGLTDGLSLIATGHSAADTYLAVAYYEFFKLYVWTGNEAYREMALFIEKNTKQTMNLDNRYHYVRESFMAEATNLAEFRFSTADVRGVWLPWITAVNVEPMCAMERTFGNKSVAAFADADPEVLREKLDAYGAGGKFYRY